MLACMHDMMSHIRLLTRAFSEQVTSQLTFNYLFSSKKIHLGTSDFYSFKLYGSLIQDGSTWVYFYFKLTSSSLKMCVKLIIAFWGITTCLDEQIGITCMLAGRFHL